MRKAVFLVALMVSMTMLSSSVLADYVCLNNTYTQFSTTLNVNGNPVAVSYPDYCPFNCTNTTGNCNNPDPMMAGVFSIALLIVAGLFIVVAIKSSAGFVFRGLNVEFLQPLFITFAFMMVLVAFTVMISGSKTSDVIYGLLGSGYNTTMWVFIFFISFIVLSFIINVLQNHLNTATRGGRK